MKRIATIGFFDGVHKGHRFLFEHLRALAVQRGLQPLIVTFDTHPRTVLQSDYTPQLLTSLDERVELLKTFGEVLILPFEDIQPLTAAEFMQRLKTKYEVEVLLMGYDHTFGSDRLRHPQDYQHIGTEVGMEIVSMTEFMAGKWHVSSTEIRHTIQNGNIAVANDLLGRLYSLSGTVVHGNGIGHTIGFPTANIMPDYAEKIIPRNGVYEVEVQGKGLTRNALCNIGTNPTVGNSERTIEVYIPRFEGDLYKKHLTLFFTRFIREEHKFDSLDNLKKQILEDLTSIF